MTITNGYTTLSDFKARFYPTSVDDNADDQVIEAVIESVSRMIDNYCGRRFYKNTNDEARYFTALNEDRCMVGDLVSVTTLATDEAEDRTYSTTWSSSADYELYPWNASLDGVPYSEIRTMPGGGQSFPSGARNVKVTGVFGWNAVPKSVAEACLIQSARLFKRKDAPFGVTGAAEMGQLQVIPRLDPDVRLLLEPYRILNCS